jgi:hypothetical protein
LPQAGLSVSASPPVKDIRVQLQQMTKKTTLLERQLLQRCIHVKVCFSGQNNCFSWVPRFQSTNDPAMEVDGAFCSESMSSRQRTCF